MFKIEGPKPFRLVEPFGGAKIDKKIWLNNVQKTFRTLADFELFLEKRNALKTLDTMVDKIKREVKERKVNI